MSLQQILEERHNRVSELENIQANLMRFQDAIDNLNTPLIEYYENLEQENNTYEEIRNKINSLHVLTSSQIPKIYNIKENFSKNRISIALAGMSGAGKSTFLQSLTGLGDDVIPAMSGEACTGTKSVIRHSNTELIEVHFHDASTFHDDVIKPYLDALDIPYIDNIRNINLPPRDEEPNPLKREYIKHLENIQGRYSEISPLLTGQSQQINKNEVEDYVSKHDGRFKYLAVKEVRISIPFPKVETGQETELQYVEIIDLPGLGDIARGYLEKLTKTLQAEANWLILLTKPENDRQNWEADVKLLSDIHGAIPEINLQDWVSLAINKKANLEDRHLETYVNTRPDLLRSTQYHIADCSEADQVYNNVLIPTINILASKIRDNDNKRINRLIETFNNQSNELIEDLQTLKQGLPKDESEAAILKDFYNKLLPDFEGNRDRLLYKLLQETEQTFTQEKNEDEETKNPITELTDKFKEEVAETYKGPNITQDQMIHRNGPPYVKEIHFLRVHITETASQIFRDYFDKLQEKIKKMVLKTLMDEKLCITQTLPEGAESLQDITPLFQDQQNIREAIEYVDDFYLEYRRLVHPLIRKNLIQLDPNIDSTIVADITEVEKSLGKQRGNFTEEDIQSIKNAYIEICKTTAFEISKTLNNSLNDSIAFNTGAIIVSLIEELRDRFCYSDYSKKEWEDFLLQYKHLIWKEKYNAIAANSFIVNNLINSIDRVENTRNSLIQPTR